MRRRAAIAVIGASVASLAGCIGESNSSHNSGTPTATKSERSIETGLHVPDIEVFNDTNNEITASIEVTTDGRTEFMEEFSLKWDGNSGSMMEFGDIVDSTSGTITIYVDSGPTKEYSFDNEQDDKLRLHATIYAERIEFQKTGA